MKREVFTQRDLINRLETIYGALVYPSRLMATWAHHRPIFLRLPGAAADAWLARALIEAGEGHQLLVLVPTHMETKRVQKALQHCTAALFLNRRLNADDWSEGVMLVGFNIELSHRLEDFGIIMSKRPAARMPMKSDGE
jgi:hypothetical protein